jgi:hypothetical protein
LLNSNIELLARSDNMVLYRTKKRTPAVKWILGAIVFIATLCITFSDLYGASFPA